MGCITCRAMAVQSGLPEGIVLSLTGLRLVLLVTVLAALAEAGCAVFTIDTWRNKYLGPGQSVATAGSTLVTLADLERSNGVFLGIAMSGGGSRAANFSAAVLLELEDLGLLKYVTAISSVSGSSLTAAYYGLFRDNRKDRWNRKHVREVLAKNFEARWIGRWFLPQNIARYWLTNFSRSDIMEDVLDSNLFEQNPYKGQYNKVNRPEPAFRLSRHTPIVFAMACHQKILSAIAQHVLFPGCAMQ